MAAYNFVYGSNGTADNYRKTDCVPTYWNEEQLEYANYMGLSHGQATNDTTVIAFSVAGFSLIIFIWIIIFLVKYCQLTQHRQMMAARQRQMQANFGQSPMGNSPLPVVVGGYHPSGGYPLPAQQTQFQPLPVYGVPWTDAAAPQPLTVGHSEYSSPPPAYASLHPPAGTEFSQKF